MVDDLAQRLASLPRERTQTLPALHLLHDLAGHLPTDGLEAIGRWLHVAKSELYAVASSYSEFRFTPADPDTVAVCTGLSCRIAGSAALAQSLRDAGHAVDERPCLFACPVAPVVQRHGRLIGRADAGPLPDAPPDLEPGAAYALLGDAPPTPALDDQTRRVTARCGLIDPASLQQAREAGAWQGWRAAAAMAPEEALGAVEAAMLRGRGGAYFPVHLKWRAAREAAARNGPPLLVVNAEEGEPGVFKDRFLMERDPQRLVEGIRIAAYAVGAERVYCYLNGQADLSADRLAAAIESAAAAGLLDGCPIEIRRGAGGYVCGEETVILESIEGFRAVPRLRPPFPTEHGLWGRPTVINNVETLANLPDLFRFGVDWFRETGPDDAPGTKLICVSGAMRRPGVMEVPLGTTVSHILAVARAGAIQGVVMGGPSGGLLPLTKFDRPIAPGLLDPAGAVLGSGGIVAFDAGFPAADVLAVEAAYNADESCGKCTPCREGSVRLVDALARLREGDTTARADIEELAAVMRTTSLCGLGQMAPHPLTSALQDFPSEIGASP